MATKIFGVILTLAVALALAGQTAKASDFDDYKLYLFCIDVQKVMDDSPASWANSISAYKTAMKYVQSFSNQFNAERRGLAAAWRAVTYDKACSSRSLAYVHSIYACRPRVHPSMARLDEDVRKYAQKCLTAEYIGKEFREYASADVEKFLTSDLLAAYRADNPDEPQLVQIGRDSFNGPITTIDRCYRPARAGRTIAGAVKRDFPREAAQSKRAGGSVVLLEEFLSQHLFKPCAIYVKRVDQMMDKIEAASYYAFGDDARNLPQDIQEGIFRFQFCRKLKHEQERFGFVRRVGDFL